ncbi:MAG: nucleotidyltransferase domain-containing protein [Clostridia bacterium]|nr:nucleotidyltransferase domain-containing protein [Clostridia bacterium]
MEDILEYLKRTYSPCGMIVYGSYADGTKNDKSDFDVLVITNGGSAKHDNSTIGGVVLDAFVYPCGAIKAEDFIHIYGGTIIFDTNGFALGLMNEVTRLIDDFTPKSYEENCTNIAWCEKMLLRADRNDAEGYFRWHWLLTESLEIYCDVIGKRYLGPKKSIIRMCSEDNESYCIYEKALTDFDYSSLSKWICRIKELMK